MITLVREIPDLDMALAEWVKIKCLYSAYPKDKNVMFWVQGDNEAVIAMTAGNMIICRLGGDPLELTEFVNMLNPACVFSDWDTLCLIERKPRERINILSRLADIEGETAGDGFSSKEVYSLLDVEGLSLPDYPDFAVDYCHRLNAGLADYFGIKGKCCAVSFNCGDSAIMNGIASHQKGMGSVALKGILQKNKAREFFVCCRDGVLPFYYKNGFYHRYYGGYWVKENV